MLLALTVLTGVLAIPVWNDWLVAGRGGYSVFLLTTALLLCLAWQVTLRFDDDRRWDVLTLDTATVALAIVVVLGLLLGTAGILQLHVLMLALAAIAVLFHVGEGFIPSLTHRRQSTGGDKPLPYVARPGEGASWSLADVRWPHAVLAGLVMFGIAQIARDRGMLPPVGDAIGYHLPFVGEWLQHGSLVMPVPASGDPSPPFYPLSSSLWMYWTTAPFQSDVAVRFVQAPFFVLLFLAVVRLALEIRISPAGAITAGLLTLSLPDIIRGLAMAENDVIVAALLVAATANLVMLWHRPAMWRAAMTAALLGMAIGTKVLAVPFAAVLGTAWLGIVIYHWRPESWRSVLKIALLGAGIVVLLGSYSYIRNWVVMDNPSYPARTTFLGEELFPGIYTATREWRQAHPFYSFDWPGFFGFGMRGFFGWTVPLLVLPGMVLAVVRSLRSQQLMPLLLLVWCGVSLAIFWFVIPYHFERFLFATLAWGIVVAVWGWLMLLPGRSTLLAIAVIPLALLNVSSLPVDTGVLRKPTYLLGALIIVAVTSVAVLMARNYRQLVTPARSGIALTACALLLVTAWPLYADRYEDQRFDQWGRLSGFLGSQPEAWRWLWDETDGRPATVAVAGTNATWPLYGPTLDNRIVTITHDGRLQEYDWGSPFRLFGSPDRERWLQTVHVTGVEYLWITADVSLGNWPHEDRWAAEAGFEPVLLEDDLHVWKVPARAESPLERRLAWVDPLQRYR